MKGTPLARAEAALDAYDSALAALPEGQSYRDSRPLTRMTVNCLLQDLADYAEHHRLSIDPKQIAALARLHNRDSVPEAERPHDGFLQVDDAVETIPRKAALPPTRGYVAAVHHASNGSIDYTVAFPGVPEPLRLPYSCLRSTKPFPGVVTSEGEVHRPSEAEQRLVAAWARSLQNHAEVDPGDLTDRAVLAIALGQWSGVPAERVTEALRGRIVQAAATLASPTSTARAATDPTRVAASDVPGQPDFRTGPPPSAEPRPHRPPPPARGPRP